MLKTLNYDTGYGGGAEAKTEHMHTYITPAGLVLKHTK